MDRHDTTRSPARTGDRKELNQTYQRVIKSLGTDKESGAAKEKLVLAQRAWVKFREADCEAVYETWAGGTIRTVMHIACMQHHAQRRIKDLEDYADNR